MSGLPIVTLGSVAKASLAGVLLVVPCLFFTSAALADQPVCPKKWNAAIASTIWDGAQLEKCDTNITDLHNFSGAGPTLGAIMETKDRRSSVIVEVETGRAASAARGLQVRSSIIRGSRNSLSDRITQDEALRCIDELTARCRELGY